MIPRSTAKPSRRQTPKNATKAQPSAVTPRVLEHLSEVASMRLADHRDRFRKDYKASRQNVEFLAKVVENDDTAPIELLLGITGNRVSAKTQATQDLIRIRDENAELILAAQQNAEKISAGIGNVSSSNSLHQYGDVDLDPGLCTEWRRSVFHFGALALMAAQQSAQLHRRERHLLSAHDIAQRTALVIEENKCITMECAELERELAELEREGEWLDARMARWSTEESFFDSLPDGEGEWKRLFLQMQRFVKGTQVPYRELEAVKDLVDAVVQMTCSPVASAQHA
jgi:hypothetical protein